MKYDWQWSVYFQPAADGSGTWIHYLVVGLGWTLATALAAWVIALVLGSVIGTLRTTPMKWVVRLGNAYVEIFRNVPLLVQMFLWFFVVPEFLPKDLGDAIKQMPPPWSSYLPAVLCLGLYTSVRVAEQVRAGIQSLPRGQMKSSSRPRLPRQSSTSVITRLPSRPPTAPSQSIRRVRQHCCTRAAR